MLARTTFSDRLEILGSYRLSNRTMHGFASTSKRGSACRYTQSLKSFREVKAHREFNFGLLVKWTNAGGLKFPIARVAARPNRAKQSRHDRQKTPGADHRRTQRIQVVLSSPPCGWARYRSATSSLTRFCSTSTHPFQTNSRHRMLWDQSDTVEPSRPATAPAAGGSSGREIGDLTRLSFYTIQAIPRRQHVPVVFLWPCRGCPSPPVFLPE